jgi:hypothetical protein
MFGPPHTCPNCNGFEFRPSRTGVLRYFLLPMFLRPFRCYSCSMRVWRFSVKGEPYGVRWKSKSGQIRKAVSSGNQADPPPDDSDGPR